MPRPDVTGKCPACGVRSLFLSNGGYVTCRVHGCPDPTAAADLLLDGPRERAILLDLIAEVRAMGDGWWEGDEAADRAEARLREVTGDE